MEPTQEARGESEAFLQFQDDLSRVADVDRPVLVIGERGSGKELATYRLHYLSKRWDGPFVALNCSALPQTLLEAELFGHEAGAFTGASKRRKGRFEEAEGGTLFLDEIGLIPLEVQEKILRVVEYGRFERVGSSVPIEVNVRIIGATNADLKALSRQGKFKEDLLDRLSFEVLFLPPLRARKEDILLLARYFAASMFQELGKSGVPYFSEEAEKALMEYAWPGNIRELKNVVERAVYRSETDEIDSLVFDPFKNPFQLSTSDGLNDLVDTAEEESDKFSEECNKDYSGVDPVEWPLEKFKEFGEQAEISFLKRALKEAQYKQKEAAALLNLTYDQFRGLYRKYRELLDGIQE